MVQQLPQRESGFTQYMPIYLAISILLAIVFATISTSSAPAQTLDASNSVVSEISFGQTTLVGTATTYARGDHSHGTPVTPTYTFLGNIPISVFNSGVGATATSYWSGAGTWATLAAVVDDDSMYAVSASYTGSISINTVGSLTGGSIGDGFTSIGWKYQSNNLGTASTVWTQNSNGIPTWQASQSGTPVNYMPAFVAAATSAINWASGINQVIVLSGTTSPFTFSGGTAGYTYNLEIVQSSSGNNYASWPASTALTWSGGFKPILSTTANATDTFTFYQRTSTLMRAIGVTYDQK